MPESPRVRFRGRGRAVNVFGDRGRLFGRRSREAKQEPAAARQAELAARRPEPKRRKWKAAPAPKVEHWPTFVEQGAVWSALCSCGWRKRGLTKPLAHTARQEHLGPPWG